METSIRMKKRMTEAEVKGRMAFFKELRVDKDIIPDGMYCYTLRHENDHKMSYVIERNVTVNYF